MAGLHLRPVLAVWCLWAAAACGTGGMAAGLAAAARGGRVPVRALVCAAALASVALVALPPAGSTDALDYAAYGRIAELGHSPYLMSPLRLARIGDPFGRAAPRAWDRHVSVYGPLATAEQLAAARLAGRPVLRAMFWLKVFNALAFGAVALAAGRLLRGQPGRRARAHLLWTANPLLIWGLIAGGHVDAVAAALGFLGLAAAVVRPGACGPAWPLALAAGMLTGAAAAVKVNFLLFAVALAWACRRSAAALAAAAAGLAAAALPLYAWTGQAAVRAVLRRTGYTTIDSGYALVFGRAHQHTAAELLLTMLAAAAVAALLLRRPPPGSPHRPAVRVALLLSVAWLLIWPYQLPWYDTMAFCLLVLVPAAALDWLLLARLLAGSVALMTPLWAPPHIGKLHAAAHWVALAAAPVILIAVLAVTVALAVSGRWAGLPSWRPSPPAVRTGPAP